MFIGFFMPKHLIFKTMGNVELLSQNKLAVFSSRKTPKTIHAAAESLFKILVQLPLSLAGGWQAPLEKKLFNTFAQSPTTAHYIYYLAKDISTFKPNPVQEALLKENRLLTIAPGLNQNRPTRKQVDARDQLLFEQVSKALFLFIEEGGRLEEYVVGLSARKYPLYILEHPLNEKYFGDDIIPLNEDNAAELLT